MATDAQDRRLFDAIRQSGHRVLGLDDALKAAVAARRNQSLAKRGAASSEGAFADIRANTLTRPDARPRRSP